MGPEEIGKIIDLLVEKLGPMGKIVWEIYLRQIYLTGLMQTVGGVIFIVGFAASLRLLLEKRKDPEWFDEWGWILVVLGIFGVFSFAMAGFSIIQGVLQLLNPQYYAIQMLLGR